MLEHLADRRKIDIDSFHNTIINDTKSKKIPAGGSLTLTVGDKDILWVIGIFGGNVTDILEDGQSTGITVSGPFVFSASEPYLRFCHDVVIQGQAETTILYAQFKG